jgi:hypothetical protein
MTGEPIPKGQLGFRLGVTVLLPRWSSATPTLDSLGDTREAVHLRCHVQIESREALLELVKRLLRRL